ncbi:hypothetical protein ACFC18_11110 [Streptomyces sp. NPDC056121]|uniref:hypothetical protein n=1 Tax=Streptomyces TaxID=1883 RepID=UPI001D0BC438|nr:MULTISPECIES: hypothetical protein [Streptomyces]MCX5084822.1 hypothetical protein [Streptomyces sp. NBC_00401]UDM03890.1 hypothetical protein LGI35_39395 [Streptomyces longhuiensis]
MTQPHGQQIPADPACVCPGEQWPQAERRPRAWREYGTLLMAIVGLTLSLTTFLVTALR